jgi:hypothetical protein
MTTDFLAGDAITNNTNSPADPLGEQQMNSVASTSCGGRVQSTAHGDATNCPFTITAYDKQYWNDKIVKADYEYPSLGKAAFCIGDSFNGIGYTPASAGCSATGTNFARDGNYGWVNVYASDQESVEAYLCSSGTSGRDALLQGWLAGYCQLALENS